ncbi:hypothetical protein [Haliangium ochraceum]|uniref:Uncharacterized protein n=1 Tax=Haliangium ochraceum (strain DSM 14365 / JCM 11303 / SMP-2) TaxID=502025 RepID=D0LH59_HALO1|nr:hypothetical protein [Haliangium ochraceum]ACY18204.1 hypothetical protein Hoch_5727 [Haliangium ochraceum DSM 14365]
MVCAPCAADSATCPLPRAHHYRLGFGRRLRQIDPLGEFVLVSGNRRKYKVYGLGKPGVVNRRPRLMPPPEHLPRLSDPHTAPGSNGRVVWLPLSDNPLFRDDLVALRHLRMSTLPSGETVTLHAKEPLARMSDIAGLALSRSGKTLWFRTPQESVCVWSSSVGGPQREYKPLRGAVLQSAYYDEKGRRLALTTYGHATVHRVEDGELALLGRLAIADADNVWVSLVKRYLVVLSDYRGKRGFVLRAFACRASGEFERTPCFTWAESEPLAGSRRRLRVQRPLMLTHSPSGRFVAIALADKRIAVHDIEQRSVQFMSGHTGSITALRFTDGDAALITGDDDNRVVVSPRQGGEHSG